MGSERRLRGRETMRAGTLAMLIARHNHPKAQQGVLLLRNGWAQVEGVGS